MRLFNCLHERKCLATGQRKPDFFRRSFIPKCNCFVTHFFLSLKVEKFLAAKTVELAKGTGFQHGVSDEPNETDPWQPQMSAAPLTTPQQG